MIKCLLRASIRLKFLFVLLMFSLTSLAQTNVFSEDFTTSRGTTYTTLNGPIGTSPNWTVTRSGTDLGARINAGLLTLTNDATGSYNMSGWVLASANTSSFGSPYTPTLNSNAGVVTWTFNMRQSRSNPSGPASGYYGNAFILAGTSSTTATTGSGYAVTYGQYGSTDPIRIVRYTAGLRSSQNVLTTINATSDIGNQYLSVKVTYSPSTGKWELYTRIDGSSAFQDPNSGTLTLVGSGSNTAPVTSLPLIGAFWNAGIRTGQTASFDNIKVDVAVPAITSISPTSKVANTGAFNLVVTGTNFSAGSVVRWNGSNRVTTVNSANQLTAAILATDIAAAGTASITVGTGTAVSNAQIFTIDPAATPSVSTSTNALPALTSITGTASVTAQSFTVTGANLTADVNVTVPANFEVSKTSATGGYGDTQTLLRSGTTLGGTVTLYIRLKAGAPAGLYSGNVSLSTTNGATKLVAVSGTVYAVEPATSDTPVTFGTTTSVSMVINWTNGAGSNHLVLVKAVSAVDAAPDDGTGYTASTVFGSGTEIGTGNYVVYNSTGNTVTVTGLSPATTYHVSVFGYNGAAGSQNYRITSPGINNKLTLNAPVGLQLTALNTAFKIDFDTTVEGVNNDTFNGGGANTAPGSGELNSNAWAITGFSDGSIAFGGDSPEDSSYESGTSAGGEIDEPGLYAFEVAPDNFALGVQPAPGEFAPGSITLKFQNQTSGSLNTISVGYKVYLYNDQPGSSTLNFSHSASASGTYIPLADINHTTTAAADAAPGWKAYYKVVTITGLNITTGSYYYLRWTGATATGTVFDEIALDDISIVATPSSTYATFNGTAETFTLAGNATLNGNTTVEGNINFAANSPKLIIGSNTLTLHGTVTNTSGSGLRGSASSNLIVGGTTAKTISFDTTTAGTTNLFNNVSIVTTGATTTTVDTNLAINGTLTVDERQTLNLGTNALSGALATVLNNGTLLTQNTSAAPLPSGKTWGGTGTINFNAATAVQNIVAGTYNNVTVSTTGGAVAATNITVNGILNLPNANPSATVGSLSTGTNTLFMGPSAVNTGVGDVSGIITRNQGIIANVRYTFGHPNTSILMPAIGTLPTSMSIKVIPGVLPANKPGAVLRTYDFIQTGGTGTKAIIQAHYLDSELNGNVENRLVDYVVQLNPSLLILEQSRTNYSTTENYVELANVNVSFFSSNFGDKLLTFDESANTVAVWNGTESNVWIHAANWTPPAVPSNITAVIIPNAANTNFDPELDPTVAIRTLTIETGGILNTAATSELTVTGDTGAWINNGTFNAGSGTVVFNNAYDDPNTTLDDNNDVTIAGTTRFNNITVGAQATLRAVSENYMNIAGTFTKTGLLAVGSVRNTIEYSGVNQTIAIPNGPLSAYNNLVISGTGAIFPASQSINGNLTINQSVDFTGKAISLTGNTVNQFINGTVAPVFSNLTINKAAGEVYLGTSATVSGTLSLTSGLLNIQNNNLTLGTSPVAGTFSTTNMIVAEGTGVVRRPFASTGSYLFPIGEKTSNTSYSPITVNVTAGTFNNAFVDVNVRDAVHPSNRSINSYMTRYWNVTQTGITNAVATITANYTTGDAVGGEGTLAAAQLNGTFNMVSNPWVKFAPLASNTLTATGAVLTPGTRSVFTGITKQSLIANITGEGTFCQNDVVQLSSEVTGGDAPFTYTWSNLLGSESTATPSTATAGTTTYSLTVRDANGIASTDTADVVVSSPAVAGVLSGSQELCAGTTPQAITLSGYTGTVVRWERSTSATFQAVTFINNTTATLSGSEIGNLTTTRYIRAVIQNGSCPVVYTEPVLVSIVSTTWDGTTWSNGLPRAAATVIFNGDYTAQGDINACTIQVAPGANVVIPSGINVIVNGAVTVNGGTFTLRNNANLIQLTNAVNTGNIVVERNSSPLFRQDYTMWSTPVTGTKTLQEFSEFTLPTRFYTYSTLANTISAVNAAQPFVTGEGYLIRMPNSLRSVPGYDAGTTSVTFTGIFTGVPNNGPVTHTLTDAGSGFNFIGNPYPSPINITQFLTANQQAINGTIWIWRKRNNPNMNSSYVTINSVGVYVGNGEPNTQTDPNGIVRTGQGFLVKVKDNNTTNDITFTNAMRSANVSNQFFRTNNDGTAGEIEKHGIWLNLTNDTGFFSQMYTGYITDATVGEDNGIDSKFFGDSPIVLASLINDGEYIIQGRPLPFIASDVVPLLFKSELAGSFTVSIDHMEGLFNTNQDVYLKDKFTDVLHDLKAGSYTFTTETGTFNDRFEIVYLDSTLGTANPDGVTANEVVVYKQDKALHITSGTANMKDVTIFDVRGRLLYSASNINATSFVIDDLSAEQQMLIVNITTDKGKVSKKVIY